MDSVLVKLRKLISGFNRSSKRKRQFGIKQAERGLPIHQPIHDKPTRWGSTFDMVERFLEQQAAFCAVLVDDRKSWHLMLQDFDNSVLETVRDVLGPRSDFTDAMSGEKTITISCVQPVMWTIFNVLALNATDSNLTSEMKQKIADDLKNRYTAGEITALLDCATYFDVRFKNTLVVDLDAVHERLLNDTDNMVISIPMMNETPE